MKHEILHRPSFAMAQITLDRDECLQAEPGAMVSMSNTIHMDTQARGGILKGLRRSVLGSESFFINTFTARDRGTLEIAPPTPGDIDTLELTGESIFIQSGSFLAATTGIDIDTKWGGAKTFFSSEGLFMLRCRGTGTVFVSSYGAIHRIALEPSEEYTVDTGHMVAFEESVKYTVGRTGSWKSTFLGGEGLVCKLEGPGRFYMQTRSSEAFVEWLARRLPTKK